MLRYETKVMLRFGFAKSLIIKQSYMLRFILRVNVGSRLTVRARQVRSSPLTVKSHGNRTVFST